MHAVAAQSPADELTRAALTLARRDGMGALTARAVAQAAGMRPSAVNYHLGGWDGLRRAVCLSASAQAQAWRAEQAAHLAAIPAETLSPAAVVSSIVCNLAEHAKGAALLLAEFRVIAGRGDKDLCGGPQQDWHATQTFWRDVLERLGEPEHAIRLWGLFAVGAFSLAALDGERVQRLSWVINAAQRIADRLAGRPPAPLVMPVETTSAPIEAAATPDGKRRIIEAAIRIIGERGIDELTHRRVAAEAGVSLAATTYFFEGRMAIALAAFRELHSRVMAGAAEPPRSMSDLLLTAHGAPRPEVGAIHALYTAAARDPALKPFAADLRRLRGKGTLAWLHDQAMVAADPLDGLIWSLIMAGLYQNGLLLPEADRRAFIDTTSARLLGAYFQGALA